MSKFPPFLLCLFLLLCGVPCMAHMQENPTLDRATWADRLSRLENNYSENQQTAYELTKLSPDVGYAILRDNWKYIKNGLGIKEMLLGTFVSMAHPHVLDVLHLGATDPSLQIQNTALTMVQAFACRSFVEDYTAYLEWYRQYAGKPVETVLQENCRAFAARLAAADDTQVLTLVQEFTNVYTGYNQTIWRLRQKAALEAGLLDAAAKWLVPGKTHPAIFQLLRFVGADETYLRRYLVPLAAKTQPNEVRSGALSVLATPEHRWASEILLKMIQDEYPDPSSEMLLGMLAQISDPRSIPPLIGMLEADKTPEGIRIIGGTLGQMTNVPAGMAHDGAWWRRWWERNKLRFAEDVRALPIPVVPLRRRPVLGPGVSVGNLPQELHQIAGDSKRAYWLIRPPGSVPRLRWRIRLGGAAMHDMPPPPPPGANPAPPQRLPGLLVVLAGGDGNGGSVLPFWSEALLKALKGNYLIALPVAPKWSANQPVPWVTQNHRQQVKEAAFTTESFVADVVKDVIANQQIDPERIFLHGVAESGPAVYACSLQENTPFKGFYILASAFKSTQLPPLARARHRRYFLQHSKDDKVSPYWMASAAQKLLSQQGASVKLVPYKGNHGYDFADDIWKQMGEAISWLEGAH
ncbi:MAG TPA: hypothetical protein VFB38_19140 [Chthonomonadaceae bacterium]|nr:hypothetical protein [Chthonomonadaceae bacterium]